ncbi:MAG: 2TM domain-containing protein [Polaromonas sp.]
MSKSLSQEELENLARKRAAVRMGWYIHALVFIALNAVFATASLFTGRHWAVFPAFGWGLGLMIHALVVFMALPGSGLHERLLQQERQKLAMQRDPW